MSTQTYFDFEATGAAVGFATLVLPLAEPVRFVRFAEDVLTLVAGALAPVMPIPVAAVPVTDGGFAAVVVVFFIFDF